MSQTSFIFALLVVLPRFAAAAERWDGSALEGAGVTPPLCEPVELFPGRTFPAAVHTLPFRSGESDRLLVAGLHGEVWDVPAHGELTEDPPPAFKLGDVLAPSYATQGRAPRLMSVLLDRAFPERRYLFVFCNVLKAGAPHDCIFRLSVTGQDPLRAGDPVELLAWPSNGHDGGEMQWGPDDGMLYVSAGDGSTPGDPNNIGQRVDAIHGSILRLDVHGESPCSVPPDNPFVGLPDVRPEIWSYGLRNPWRITFHPDRRELWAADNGDESWELIHRVRRGANAGWSAFEGSHPFRLSNPLAGPTLTQTPPVVEHPHTEMRSVIGGIFYRGTAMPELQDHYLYGCYFTRRLWAISYADGVVGTPFEIGDAGGDLVAIAEGHDREPIVTCHNGRLFGLRPVASEPPARPWPAQLSETNLLADTATGTLAPGVRRYLINAESWADGATRDRFIAIARGEKLRPTGGEERFKSWIVPVGTAIGQTLSLAGRPVETQLLYFDGTWRGFTYRWDAEGRDATLVDKGGENAEIAGQPWRFHSRAECMTCHTQRSNFANSLTTRQLDRVGSEGRNQLDEWIAQGLLEDNGPLRQARNSPQPDPYDASLPLDARARSYLQLNCAHCHRESGLGGRAGFQLLDELTLEQTGILDTRPTVGLLGIPGARIVAPGKPDDSELLARMNRRGPGQMPLVGSHVIDKKGVALIRDWIRSLSSEPD